MFYAYLKKLATDEHIEVLRVGGETEAELAEKVTGYLSEGYSEGTKEEWLTQLKESTDWPKIAGNLVKEGSLTAEEAPEAVYEDENAPQSDSEGNSDTSSEE